MDSQIYCAPEGADVARVKADEPWSHCPTCVGSNTMWVDDHFTCKECCNEWAQEYDHYDHEPEINFER